MISLESNCIDISLLNNEEKEAITYYRGAATRDFIPNTDRTSYDLNTKNHSPPSTERLITHLSKLFNSDVHVFDLTDSLLTIPVVKVHVSTG